MLQDNVGKGCLVSETFLTCKKATRWVSIHPLSPTPWGCHTDLSPAVYRCWGGCIPTQSLSHHQVPHDTKTAGTKAKYPEIQETAWTLSQCYASIHKSSSLFAVFPPNMWGNGNNLYRIWNYMCLIKQITLDLKSGLR